MSVELTLINNSNEFDNSAIVIFQKNIPTESDESAIAWRVISDCGVNCTKTFHYPTTYTVAVRDSFGNTLGSLTTQLGEQFAVENAIEGTALHYSKVLEDKNTVEVISRVNNGYFDVLIYGEGELLCQKTGLTLGTSKEFILKPEVYIGVVRDIIEGQVMNSEIIDTVETLISLQGVRKGNIIMTGGGPSQGASPYKFHLEVIA